MPPGRVARHLEQYDLGQLTALAGACARARVVPRELLLPLQLRLAADAKRGLTQVCTVTCSYGLSVCAAPRISIARAVGQGSGVAGEGAYVGKVLMWWRWACCGRGTPVQGFARGNEVLGSASVRTGAHMHAFDPHCRLDCGRYQFHRGTTGGGSDHFGIKLSITVMYSYWAWDEDLGRSWRFLLGTGANCGGWRLRPKTRSCGTHPIPDRRHGRIPTYHAHTRLVLVPPHKGQQHTLHAWLNTHCNGLRLTRNASHQASR